MNLPYRNLSPLNHMARHWKDSSETHNTSSVLLSRSGWYSERLNTDRTALKHNTFSVLLSRSDWYSERLNTDRTALKDNTFSVLL